MDHHLKPGLFEKDGLLSLHASHRPEMRKVATLVAVLLSGLLLSIALPPFGAARGIAHYLPLHTLLETLAVVVAVMVSAIAWNVHTKKTSPSIVLLGVAFLGVGLLDFSHMLSYAGMPDYVTPSGSEKAINFWLLARALAAVALLAVAVVPWRTSSSPVKLFVVMASVLPVVAIAHWLILWHSEWLPRTFIPGEGLTAFKIYFEYAIIAINILAAIVLWRRMRQPQPFNAVMLFGAVCVMAMGEYFFTLYADVTDIYNLLGHVYKVLAYLLIYRAIVFETVEQPYHRLSFMQAQMQATLNAVPDLMFEVDEKGFIRDFHSAVPELLAVPPERFLNKTVHESLPQESADVVMAAIHDAGVTGRSHGKQYQLQAPQGDRKWYELSVARKTGDMNGEHGYVMLARDITKLKENEAVLKMQAQRSQILLNLPKISGQMDEKSFMQYAQEQVEDLTGSKISFIHLVNRGGEEIELVAWSRRTLEHYCTAAYDSHYPLSKAGIWADALREGKAVIFNDYPNYPHKRGLPEGHSTLQRLISVPVIEGGEVVMLAGVGNKDTDYTDLDCESVQLIATEIWHNVKRARNENKLARLTRALDRSKNEIYLLDPKTWLFMDANQGALEKTGYSLKELTSLTVLDLKPEFKQESYAALLAPLLSGEKKYVRLETNHRAKDGNLYPVEVHLEMTHDEPPLLMQVALDITERKRTESLLHEQLDELQRWQQAMFGRENRIISMKQEINELLARSGQPPRYADHPPEKPDGGVK
ncbi:MAG: MASE3 domain-containing protein [Hylemonella sp.]|nr:MASE3 domain-containing protein [Hylemonella sp.]